MTVSNTIDYLLHNYQALNNSRLIRSRIPNDEEAIEMMRAYGLIVVSAQNTYERTQKWYEAVGAGGFDKWRDAVEKREQEAHQANLKSARSSLYSAIAAWIAVGVSLAPYIPNVFDGSKSKSSTDSTAATTIKPLTPPQSQSALTPTRTKSLPPADSMPMPKGKKK